MPYHFTGCAPFVEAAADSLGLTDARQRALARSQVPVSRVQTALSQAAGAKPLQREAILAEALKWRAITAVALAGIDSAIADAHQGLGLTDEAPEPPINLLEASPSNRTPPRRGR